MILSENYKKRIAELSGLIVCEKCYNSWEKDKKDKNPFLCHRCGFDSKKEEYNVEELKKWLEDKYGNIIPENVGPGPTDTIPMSDIYVDLFNKQFNSNEFNDKYDPDNGIFWGEQKYETKNQKSYSDKSDELRDDSDLEKEEIKKLDKQYRRIKKLNNWKRGSR